MDLVLLAAGASTRYNTPRPKFWLTMYDGRFMIEHAIDPFVDQVDTIWVAVQVEHEQKYNVSETLTRIYGNRVQIVRLDGITTGPAATASVVLSGIADVPVFIKDCDSFFNCELPTGNFICTNTGHSDLGMSYVTVTDNIVTDIAEKRVISNIACVGGYGFASSRQFVEIAAQYNADKEFFISDVVKQLTDVQQCEVSDYCDLGTLNKFIAFNRQHQTIFCDIDGVVVENQSEFFPPYFTDAPVVLQKNCDRLLELQAQGAEIVFVTARPDKFADNIRDMLTSIGFKNFRLLAGLHHSQRVLINDFNITNPNPSACAVNLIRNSDDLGTYL